MSSLTSGVAGRARWVIAFALLLLMGSAVPVFAESDPDQLPAGEVRLASEDEAQKLPDASDIAEGEGELREEEDAERRWLESPEAEREREESQLAYADASPSDAAELLDAFFAEHFALLDRDPSRALSDAKLEQVLDPTGAQVTVGGDTMLMEGSLPVQAPSEDGEMRKVDLDLVAVEGGFAPANPLIEVELPASASESIAIGEEGLAIAPVLTESAGEARLLDGEDVQYHETQEDTDLIAAPLGTGLELFSLLRSVQSPEELRFDLTLPTGAELLPDERGGVEVVRDKEQLARIPAPTALDAQGTEVPVAMGIEGTQLVLSIEHRSMAPSYPLLVDPAIQEDWYNGYNSWYQGGNLWALSHWYSGSNDWGRFKLQTTPINASPGLSNRGLFVAANPFNAWQPADHFAQFTYTAPGADTYFSAALVNPFWRWDQGCGWGSYPEPHDYSGLWNETWGWAKLRVNWARQWGYSILTFDDSPPEDAWKKKIGNVLVLGLGTGNGGPAISCTRDLYAGGVTVYMDDWYNPTINQVTGIPTGWFSDTPPLSINVSASDSGLGVRPVKLFNDGKGKIGEDTLGNCTGLRNSLCPANRNAQLTPTALSFGEGIRGGSITAEDPTGKTAESFFQVKVDRSKPAVDLTGQLAAVTDEDEGEAKGDEKAETLRLPVYKLTIKATDIGTETDPEKKKRSGVKDIKVFLDGSEMTVPWQPTSSCPQTSCPKEGTYTLALSKVETVGKHNLLVKAIDFAGNEKVRDIEFEYFPATGMKDEYAMHYFPLPDGQGNEAEEEHPARPELAVNVMNGNLVYRERDIDVEGTAAVDLEVERYYNSQLPASESTEWGEGWTLAQTPGLEPVDNGGSNAPEEAELLETSGAIAADVELPTEAGAETFDPALQATLTKKSNGGYKLTDETGESATSVVFDETGQTEARLTEGYAKVDYAYAGGELSEIAVEDPGSAGNPTEPPEEEPGEQSQTPVYVESFGSLGSENGQLKSPGDVAVDGQGNLWVLDTANNRIQKFDSKGQYLAKFGAAGTGNGQFKRPAAIAIAANDDLLIADAGNQRIQRFNSAGEYLGQFGSKGSAAGQFGGTILGTGPEGLAIDAAGNIWVADTINGRLEKFNSKGEFLKSVGSKGTGTGQLTQPMGIALDAGGNAWVAEYGNNRVSVFNNAGEYLSQVGSAGSGDGQFNHPDAIGVDSHGNVWVSDQGNGRIQRFDVAGQYQGQFGTKGSGAGQFSFAYPTGIASDDSGAMWITDSANNRVQKWVIPEYLSTYTDVIYDDAFGLAGAGDGQLSSPADVAIDAAGNTWVADRANNRIEKFNVKGEFVSKFGTPGTGNGQFKSPTALAIDSMGNIWVVDRGNQRVEKFSPSGEYLSQFGSKGTGNGQFGGSTLFGTGPEGIAIDAHGNIWVADTVNGRLEKFGPEGEFLKAVGSKGSGAGQFGKPTGIDIGPGGKLWVADWQYNRVSVFNNAGEYLSQFGSEGSATGQFNHPDAIDVDAKGNIWVGDQGNNRVQLFDHEGKYVDQFGSQGSGEEQFSLAAPMGIATDGAGGVQVTDTANGRVQKWVAGNYVPDPEEEAPEPDDPAVEVDISAGLVDSVSGEEAGMHAYVHEGDLLTAHEGPQGETAYEYDAEDRLTKVTLPNGTWATIEYEALGRVKEVSVSIEGGAAKTTHFTYKDDSPRRTTVEPPDAPHVVYDIGDDGSVLKWWNTEQPPELDLSGTLYDNREEDGAIWAGDHWLDAEALSEEGIKSIDVLVNGNTLVDEMTCEQDFEVEGKECKKVIDEWVTETGLHAPGHLQIEVIATDALDHSASERFWVDIPEPPPPPAPGTPIAPRFRDIAKFREDYGLEVVFPVANEIELNERIFDLIKAWHEPNTLAGEVARASMDRWGVPLRPADVAELEYREWYIEQNGPKIQQWGEANHPNTYAGYWVDHRAGGVMRVGFTTEQVTKVSALRQSGQLVATERIGAFTGSPSHPISELVSLQAAIGIDDATGGLTGKITRAGLDIANNLVTVGATDVAGVDAGLRAHYGSGIPISVYVDSFGSPSSSRFTDEGPVKAGQIVAELAGIDAEGKKHYEACTAGPSAWENVGTMPNGQQKIAKFLLTAGHCFKEGSNVLRFHDSSLNDTKKIGEQRSRHWQIYEDIHSFEDDGAAVRLNETTQVGPDIIGARSSKGAGPVQLGMTVCMSLGWSNRVSCQPVKKPAEVMPFYKGKINSGPFWQVSVPIVSEQGDSGSPVVALKTGKVVGINAFGPPSTFTPLLAPPLPEHGPYPYFEPFREQAPGLLNRPFMGDLHLVKE